MIKKGVRAVFRREIGRIKSRPIYWVLMLILPLFSYLFFTSLLSDGLPSEMPVGIVDLDNTSTSRMLARQIDATQPSQVVGQYDDFNQALYAMQEGKIYAFVVIPANFQTDLLRGLQPEVPFYGQNSYYIAGSLLMKDLTVTIGSVAAGVNLKTRLAKGQSERQAMAQIQPIANDVTEMGNSWINYSVYLSTIMLPGILQLLILITTVFSIGTELKHRNSRRWLVTANKSIVKALIGKLLPYTIVFIVMAFFANVLMFNILSYPFNGSWWQMGFGIVLFVIAQQGLGVMIIGLIPSLRTSLSIVAILGTLGISFTGLTFPVEGMPLAVQSWSYIFPLRYYFDIYISQGLTGAGMVTSWTSYLSLMVFIVLPVTVMPRLKKALIRQNFPTV